MVGNLPYTDIKLALGDKRDSLCINLLVQTVWFVLNTCFPSGSLEFGDMPGRGFLPDQRPVETLSFPSRQHSHLWSQLDAGGIECVLCDRPWERSLGNLCLVPLDFAP